MPSPMNKRRRISEDGQSSPIKQSTPTVTTPSRTKPNVLPNFMTPTKASLAKSYPHLAKQQQPRGHIPSPTRQTPRRSIAPEGLTDVVEVNGATTGRSFLEIANDGDQEREATIVEPTRISVSVTTKKSSVFETQLSREEEIERQKGILMRRVRLLRAECENLEQQLEQARLSRQNSSETQRKAKSNIDATIQLLLRSNDTSLSRQPAQEVVKPALPTAAPKKLKNPLPLLRFIYPLTFYSTSSRLIPVGDELIRQSHLKGYAMKRELYFDLIMSVNEKQERITDLEIKTSPWATSELSQFLQGARTTLNAQIALNALSTYAKLSSQRSLIFSRLAKDLPDLILPALSSTMSIVSRKGKERESDTSLPTHRATKLWLGERSISFRRGVVGIVVSWDIIIDSQGFAGSYLSVKSTVPQNWREVDDGGILDGLAGVFDSLVRSFGVERAVKTVVGVIFEEE